MGYFVYLCAGNLGAGGGFEIPELYHHHPGIKQITRNAFANIEDYDHSALLKKIENLSHCIEDALATFINTKKIDLLIFNNIWSVGLNLPAAVSLDRVCIRSALHAIAHHHDFYWERRGVCRSTCQPVESILEDYLPPHNPSIKHVVINSLAKKVLADRTRSPGSSDPQCV